MNPVKLSPDDPKLTAYALGELDHQENEAVAAAIQNDPVAQRAVAEIRKLSSKLEVALAHEPIEGLPPLEEPAVAAEVRSKVVPFPYYMVAGAAAACFAMVVALRTGPGSANAPVANSSPGTEVAVAPREAAPAEESAVAAVNVARFRQLPTEKVLDIRPAPSVEGGLKLGKTVVSNDAPVRGSDQRSPFTSNEEVPVDGSEAVDLESNLLSLDSNEGSLVLSEDLRNQELFTSKVKVPAVDISHKIEIPLVDSGTDFSKSTKDFKFAAAVAGFGMLLSEPTLKGTPTYDQILKWAQESQTAPDPAVRENEFSDLTKKAKAAVE